MDNEIDNYESNLYKYLALNDTIHDFGKGEERGGEQRLNINNIVENILSIPKWRDYNLMGKPGLFKKGTSFEGNTEKFILQKFNLPGIPFDLVDEYLIKGNLGDPFGPTDIPIIEFKNDNGFYNYAIVLTPKQISELTETQIINILESPSNIHSSIEFIATMIIKDEDRLFKATKEEAVGKGIPKDKYNKIGQFIMNFYFETSNTLGHASDAGNGHIKCLFSEGFQPYTQIIGTIRNTTTYGDSAVTGGDDAAESCGLKGKDSKKEQNSINPFTNDIGRNPNLLKFPSLFPQTNTKSNRNIFIFKNNLLTKTIFRLAYVENPNYPWVPLKAPRNFSFCVYYIGNKPTTTKAEFDLIDEEIIKGTLIPIGQSNFYPSAPPDGEDEAGNPQMSINGPSVPYLKELIYYIYENDLNYFKNTVNGIKPGNTILQLGTLLSGVFKVVNPIIRDITRDHPLYLVGIDQITKQKYLYIQLLLDIKRCGDYEQVDSIKLIQDQNSGAKNEFGLQDIMFSTIDRLCSLYSRFRNNNVVWARTSPTPLYQFYRQPYIPLNPEILKDIQNKRLFNQLKNKAITIVEFLKNLLIIDGSKSYKPMEGKYENEKFNILHNTDTGINNNDANGKETIKFIYTAIKNIVEFQNNSLFNKLFIDLTPAQINVNIGKLNPLIDNFKYDGRVNNEGLYVDGVNFKKIEKNKESIENFYNIIDYNMYCWFHIDKQSKKIGTGIYDDDAIKKATAKDVIKDKNKNINSPQIEEGEKISVTKEIMKTIFTYSVTMENKSTHQFVKELVGQPPQSDMYFNNVYEGYYNKLLQTKTAIRKIYDESGHQFWPVRHPRGDKPTVPMENLISLYNIFQGIMNVTGQIFNTGKEFLEITYKINNYLNDIINQYHDGIELEQIGVVQEQLENISQSSREKDIINVNIKYIKYIETLQNIIPNMDSKTPNNVEINTNYEDKTTKKKQLKQAKIEKAKLKAEEKAKKELDKMEKRRDKMKITNEVKKNKPNNRISTKYKEILKARIAERKNKNKQGGGDKIILQTGGFAGEDTTLGEIFMDNIFETPSIMNQIYTDLMPYQLLQDLLDNFDIDYSGLAPAGMTKEDINPDLINVLSREEYIEDFFINLQKILTNPVLVNHVSQQQGPLTSSSSSDNEYQKFSQSVNDYLGIKNDNTKAQEKFLMDDGFQNEFIELSTYNKTELEKISPETFMEKINNNIFVETINIQLKSIVNNFVTAVLNNNSVSKYITDYNNKDDTQKYFDSLMILLTWNGNTIDNNCELILPEYLGLEEEEEEEAQAQAEAQKQAKINHLVNYMIYLKTTYCVEEKRGVNNMLHILNKLKEKYGSIRIIIFYILSLITNILSNVDEIYIPCPKQWKTNIIHKAGGGPQGGNREAITYASFFMGIYNIFQSISDGCKAGMSCTISGGNKTRKKKRKTQKKRKTHKKK